ncbi:MAG TPA: beta-ketoacyl-[acyl-carrier-protein] synthase II [Planctomycetaceae bacterium]|nr:beta-ketoacyl-[acyl-carrier-protein] synthase II [Planctomycetaceae bacterium]
MRRVVVSGMGAITPIGKTLEEFWEGLRNGRCGVGPITRFDASALPCRVAAEVKNFDASDYIDKREVQRTALFSQFAMIAADEAWTHAGLRGNTAIDPDKVCILLGNGIGGLEVDTESQRKLVEKGPSKIPAMTIPRMLCNEAPGNVSMRLGLRGSAHAVVTACASGTDALGFSLDLIRSGRSDVVLTGGCEGTINVYGIGGFCSLKALSTAFNDTPEKASRPFDVRRDGFVMGEGAGVLVFEEYEHAKARNATIYAEIAGFGSTADAYHLTAPDPEGNGAMRAIRLALKDAGLEPEMIDYVNAHGTSTPTNDPVETKGIKAAFGEHAYKLKVSSTKGMTGHCLGAAGAIEALACVLAVHENFIPPTINLEEPDPECDLDYVPNRGIALPVRAAVSTSLGFGGHNSVVVVKKCTG